MKALLLSSYKNLELADLPIPSPGPDEVLIRVAACGICGSDVHGYDGGSGRRIPPIVMGHEAAGVVVRSVHSVRISLLAIASPSTPPFTAERAAIASAATSIFATTARSSASPAVTTAAPEPSPNSSPFPPASFIVLPENLRLCRSRHARSRRRCHPRRQSRAPARQ